MKPLLPSSDSGLPSVADFLVSVELSSLCELFEKEEVDTMEIIMEMGHLELRELGVLAYGHRHKIIK